MFQSEESAIYCRPGDQWDEYSVLTYGLYGLYGSYGVILVCVRGWYYYIITGHETRGKKIRV